MKPQDQIRRITDLKTVDVETAEYFDRINGNSYFAAIVWMNWGMPDAEKLPIPAQYGYGNADEHAALDAIRKRFPRAKIGALWTLRDRGVIYRHNKRTVNKRDMEAHTA